jgi:hypothetical protein
MVKLLLENHADVTIKDRTGETPASIASSIPKFNEEVKGMLLALSTKEPPKNSNTKMSPAVFRTLKKGTPVNFSARDIECIVFNNLNEITIPFAYKPAENRKQIIDLILSEPEICTPLGQNYVKKSLQLSNIIVLYLINKDVLGFATVVPQRGTILYLDVICTNYRYRGVGHHLIQDVKSIAHKNDMKFVKLDSTGPSFPFYQHEGFDLNFSTLIPMTYNITKNKTNVSKERRYTRRNSKRSNKKRNL